MSAFTTVAAFASMLSVMLNPNSVPDSVLESDPAAHHLLAYVPPSTHSGTCHCEEYICETTNDLNWWGFLQEVILFHVVQKVMFHMVSLSVSMLRWSKPDPKDEENIRLKAENRLQYSELCVLRDENNEFCQQSMWCDDESPNAHLETEICHLKTENSDLKANNIRLEKKIISQSAEIEGLKSHNSNLLTYLQQLVTQFEKYVRENALCAFAITTLRCVNTRLCSQNIAIRAELEARGAEEPRSSVFYVLYNNCLKQKNTDLKQKLETQTANHEHLCKLLKANLDGMVQQRVSLLEEQLECYLHTMLKSLNEHVTKLEASNDKATHAMLVNASKVARCESTTACDTLRIKTELNDILNRFNSGLVKAVGGPR
jgi:hypothetical protein